MLAYTYVEHGRFELQDKPKPVLQDARDAIVKVTLASICTSDLHIKHGSVPRAVPGITVGHEMVGIVEQVGEAVTAVRPGDRVTVNVETFCGECFFCQNGWVNNCTDPDGGWALGCRIDGGQVERVFKLVCDGVTDNFQRIAARQDIRKVRPELDRTGNAFFRSVQEFFCEQMDHYPKRYAADFGAFMLGGIWCSPMPDGMAEHFVEKVLSLWLKREEPYLAGQQLMLRSFFMRDFVGRKVIACLPQLQTNLWSLVFEGGHQLVLDAEMSYTKEAVSHDDLGAFSSSNIQSMLFDPIRAYGTHFLPSDLSEEWHKVFLYLCAIARTEWTVDELAVVYEKFLSFLRENICDTIPGPTGITKELYHSAQLRLIRDVRSFLRGEDEQVTSKDLHQTLNSRYVYLPHLWGLFPHEEEQGEFSAQTFRGLIEKALHADGSYEKGVLWEDAAAYLLERIGGWRITGRRIKAGAQEIDISVANVSLDDELWQLGAYILIECKNWSDRVDLHQIRNIAHISNMKGNKTALLFAANGITGDAEKEILRLAAENLSIISLDAAELRLLKSAADCRKLILDKWRELGDSVDVGSVI